VSHRAPPVGTQCFAHEQEKADDKISHSSHFSSSLEMHVGGDSLQCICLAYIGAGFHIISSHISRSLMFGNRPLSTWTRSYRRPRPRCLITQKWSLIVF